MRKYTEEGEQIDADLEMERTALDGLHEEFYAKKKEMEDK